MKSKTYILWVLTFFLLFSSQFSATAQENNNTGGFLLTQDKDTLSVEKFSRTSDKLSGRILFKKQVPVLLNSVLKEQGKIGELSLEILKPGTPEGTPPQQKGSLRFEGDKVYILTEKGNNISTDTLSTNAWLAYHPNLPVISLLEQMVLRAKALDQLQNKLPIFLLSNQGQTIDAEVRLSKNDSAFISLGNIRVALKVNSQGEILSGKTNSGQTITRINSVPDAALATSPPDYSAPENAPYTAEEVKVKTKAGHILAGTLTVPKTGNNFPVIVTITGSSPQDRDNNTPFGGPYKIFRQLADTLGREGIAVLRMDDRGIGASTGNFEKSTTPERADDIREGIEFVRSRKNLDKNKIFLVGLSEGGAIAPMIAANNKQLSGIVLLAGPASSGKEIMNYQIEQAAEQRDSITAAEKQNFIKEQTAKIEKEAGDNPWLNFFLDYDPLATAKKVKEVPVLILHGETDKNVPPQDAEKLATAFKNAGNKDVTMKMFEDVNHVFLKDKNGHSSNYENLESFEIAPEVMKTIVGWIKKRAKN